MTITFGYCSDVGLVRSDNQDFFGKFPDNDGAAASEKGNLFIVADGMGGHRAGREASEIAVKTLSQSYFSSNQGSIPERLLHSFKTANEKIYQKSMQNLEYAGMGTTCTALLVKNNQAFIGHIGDSRVYRVWKRGVSQMTEDHAKVAEMVRRGLLTKEEARFHPERSHLYRALGTRPAAEIDIIENISINRNDNFVICTDGLFNNVEDEEIQEIVLNNTPPEACRELVNLSNDRGGQDNITVQVVHFDGPMSFFSKILRRKR